MSGQRKDNLCTLSISYEAHFSTQFWTTDINVRDIHKLLHQHLRHPQASIVHVLKSKGLIQIFGFNNSHLVRKVVNQLGKLRELPFLRSSSLTNAIFDKIYSNCGALHLLILLANFNTEHVLLMLSLNARDFFHSTKSLIFSLFFQKYVELQFNQKNQKLSNQWGC